MKTPKGTKMPVKAEDFLKSQNNLKSNDESKESTIMDVSDDIDKSVIQGAPRGKPKSGRLWKTARKER